MDDYVKNLLLGQIAQEEGAPEKLQSSLEAQWGKGSTAEAAVPEEMPVSTINAPGFETAERTAEPKSWEENEKTALRETAEKRFLRRLEREIYFAEPENHTTFLLHAPEGEMAEESRGWAQAPGGTVTGERITPEGLSRVFQRDARRFS